MLLNLSCFDTLHMAMGMAGCPLSQSLGNAAHASRMGGGQCSPRVSVQLLLLLVEQAQTLQMPDPDPVGSDPVGSAPAKLGEWRGHLRIPKPVSV